MRSDDVKLETLYYSTFDDGSFAAAFYVMAKRKSQMSVIMCYYQSDWSHNYIDNDSFDWDEDDEYFPDQTWLTDSQEFNPEYDKGIKREYCLSFLSWLFNGIGE